MANLVLQSVCKRYDAAKEGELAVRNLTLDCKEGEFIGFLGPSGCGKTTTLRMIAGLETVTNGQIVLGDAVINDVHPKDRHIGLAFEDYALYPPLTVAENVTFCLQAKKVPTEEIKRRLHVIAPLLRIEDLLHMKPVSLSGGQKQRVNIARAIIREPRLLLLDEPLSHLDGKMRQAMRREIRLLQRQINCTSIIVTHDQLEAMSMADRIAIMRGGELQQFGTPSEIYDNPVNEFVADFIGEPPMNLLTARITAQGAGFLFSLGGGEILIPVPERYFPVVHDGMEVRMGVRPNNLTIGADDSPGAPVRVAVFEDLGDEVRLHFRVGRDYLTMISQDKLTYQPGDQVKLEASSEKTYLFDVRTGERIGAA